MALRRGLINRVFPVLSVDGALVPNPTVVTDQWIDAMGNLVYGADKKGDGRTEGRSMLKSGEIDFSLLDAGVEKILHAPSQDLEIFYLRFGACARNVFDTQTAD